MKKIAISQRVVENESFAERRDALDQRWCKFLWNISILPVPLPNTFADVSLWLKELNLEGLILSGGNDLGLFPEDRDVAVERNATEEEAIRFCEANRLPVLGVCRGLQVLAAREGAVLSLTKGHIATRHKLCNFEENLFPPEVNSFHKYQVFGEKLPKEIVPLAFAPDGGIEALRHSRKNHLAIMWHPEREAVYHQADMRLFANHFGAVQ